MTGRLVLVSFIFNPRQSVIYFWIWKMLTKVNYRTVFFFCISRSINIPFGSYWKTHEMKRKKKEKEQVEWANVAFWTGVGVWADFSGGTPETMDGKKTEATAKTSSINDRATFRKTVLLFKRQMMTMNRLQLMDFVFEHGIFSGNDFWDGFSSHPRTAYHCVLAQNYTIHRVCFRSETL